MVNGVERQVNKQSIIPPIHSSPAVAHGNNTLLQIRTECKHSSSLAISLVENKTRLSKTDGEREPGVVTKFSAAPSESSLPQRLNRTSVVCLASHRGA